MAASAILRRMSGRAGTRPGGGIITILALLALFTRPLVATCAAAFTDDKDRSPRIEAFEREVEGLRKLLGIPGLQVAVAEGDRTIFSRGLGYADLQADVPMTTDHLLEIASVTKTMTGVVMMQLVQEGKVSLDDRVVKYPFLPWYNPVRVNPEIRLRHALTHTSQGPLGETYCYQGNRFGLVLGVFGTATPEKFLNGEAVTRRILDPLHMENTFPRPGVAITDALKARVVKTYAEFNPTTGDPIPSPYIRELGSEAFPAGGFYSNVGDLTRFATALNDHSLLSKDSQDFMESPTLTPDGRALPYGIGWFTQNHGGLRLLWHYGYADGDAGSALLLRVPEKKLCLAVLANSGNMSGSTRLGYGDALDSPFTVAFLKHFVHAGETPHPSPPYDGDLAEIRAATADLIQKQAHPIYFEELFTQAVIRELMAGPNHDRRKAVGLLEIALDLRPEILRDSGLTGLEVLAKLDDPKLGPAAVSLAQSLLQTPAPHPAALFFWGRDLREGGTPRGERPPPPAARRFKLRG